MFIHSLNKQTKMFDIKQLKEVNHKKVLNKLRIHGELSGAELSRQIGLQPSTVVYILRHLHKIGLIEHSRLGISTKKGGKRPQLWKIKADAAYFLGIEFLGQRLRLCVLDIAGGLLHREQTGHKITDNDYDNIALIVRKTEEVVQNLNIKNKLIGLGLALPGLIDTDKGTVLYSAKLNLHHCHIADTLTEQLKTPVKIINDSNAGALSIKWFRPTENPSPREIIYLTYYEGARNLGLGIMLNGGLYTGIGGTAGEILEPLPTIESTESLNTIIRQAKTKEAGSKKIIDIICTHIAHEIMRITALLNPELVIIGGDLSGQQELIDQFILPNIKEKSARLLNSAIKIPDIRFSELGTYAVAMGAVSLWLSDIFEDDTEH